GVNGVFVQKTNHGGGAPFLRGLTGNQTLILIDGIRLNNSTFRYGPNQYFNTIDPFNINSIEVVKGSGSVQYGTDALGGVLQVFTKEPEFKDSTNWSGRAMGKYMSGDMEKTVRGEAAYSSQNVAAMVGATYRNFGDLIGGDTTGKQSPTGYKELAFDAKAKFRLKENVGLTVAHQFFQQQHVPVYHKVVLENFAVNEFDPQQRMLTYAKLNKETGNDLFKEIELIASWQQNIEGRNSIKNGSNTLRKERDEINTVGFTADVASHLSEVWSANSGIEVYTDNVNSMREDINIGNGTKVSLRGLYPDASRYTNSSVYSLHHFKLNKWTIEGGLRFNTFSIRITDTTLGTVKITPSSFVYNTALMYNLSNQHHFYATVSSGYRAPNIDDMGTLGIVDFRYEIPTASLKPEKSINAELGYKLRTKKWSGTASAYYMHLNDLIARLKVDGQIIGGYQVYAKENVEEAYIKGFEAEAHYEMTSTLQFAGNVSYTYGQNKTKNEPLRRIPPIFGRLVSSYLKNKWFLSAELLFASKQDRLAQGDKDDNRIPAGGTPGWEVVNIYGGYKTSLVGINAGLQNIFNEDYRTHGSGINGVGRSIWIAVNFRF
nr:TonB-dependent receptor [Segetibacter sp.]